MTPARPARPRPFSLRSLWLVGLCAACSTDGDPSPPLAAGCTIVQPPARLAGPLDETSGVAISRAHSGVLWTHNDSGDDAVLYAVQPTGQLLGATRVPGAENEDWEDIEIGPCPDGDCLYIADTGDNDRDRDDVAIYRLPEPAPGAAESAPAERFPLRFPDGPRDAEALFVLPSGDVYLVSKGRNAPRTLYRYPLPLRAGERVELEAVASLGGEPADVTGQITAASASPSGRWVAVREYQRLLLFSAAALTAGDPTPALVLDLTPVGEPQGEAVALLDNGRVVLTSEGGFRLSPGTVAVIQCEMPG